MVSKTTKTTTKNQMIKAGKNMACSMLERVGAEVIERDWQCPAGEAHIIAMDDGDLVFADVRVRANCSDGLPEETISAKERDRCERIALFYLSEHELPTVRVRFDRIAVTLMDEARALVRHHRDAFCVSE